jgi:hypothetical protein
MEQICPLLVAPAYLEKTAASRSEGYCFQKLTMKGKFNAESRRHLFPWPHASLRIAGRRCLDIA